MRLYGEGTVSLRLLALLAFSFSAFASAQPIPDANDLKAAYCIVVYNHQIALGQQMEQIPAGTDARGQPLRDQLAETHRAKDAGLRHMLAYLLPRTRYIDPLGLLAASKSAEADIARQNELATMLQQECGSDAECMFNVKPPETVELRRIKACDDLSFLPF
jgi:hypothetical protein